MRGIKIKKFLNTRKVEKKNKKSPAKKELVKYGDLKEFLIKAHCTVTLF